MKSFNPKILVSSVIMLLIIIGCITFTKVSMSNLNPNQICFLQEPGDTRSFASYVAINDKYLVVGDSLANRVVVYQKNALGRWYREREIYPPENSIPYKVGNGFGENIRLDQNALIVSGFSSQPTKNVTNPGDFDHIGSLNSVFLGRYLVHLDEEQAVIPISRPAKKTESYSQLHILSEGKLKLVTLPNNNEELFAAKIAVHNNWLLVGSPSRHLGGKGWLFNLKASLNQPLELTTENAHLGDTVAVSDQFAVVGNSGSGRFIKDEILYPKTLIRSLKNGSTFIADIEGYLSLDKNILAVMLSSSHRLQRRISRLQLFYLNENATPHLILERKNSRREAQYLTDAWIQNGWLITLYRFGRKGSLKLCLESVEEIIAK